MRKQSFGARLAGFAAAGALAAVVAVAAPHAADAADNGHKVRLDAVVNVGAPPIQDDVRFEVWRHQDGRLHKVGENEAGPAEFRMAPGRYRIVAEYRDARVVRDVTVENASDTRKQINLNAGEVGLELLPRVGGRAYTGSDIVWQVHRYKRGADRGGKVAEISHANPSLLLREGWYEVTANRDGRQIGHVIEVTAGARFDYSLVEK
jgi:hypothetical protein